MLLQVTNRLSLGCNTRHFQRKPKTARSRWKRRDWWRSRRTGCRWRLNRTRFRCPVRDRRLTILSPPTRGRHSAPTTSSRSRDSNCRLSACSVCYSLTYPF